MKPPCDSDTKSPVGWSRGSETVVRWLPGSAAGDAMGVSAKHGEDGFVLDARGRKTGVILSLRRYARLLDDLHDLVVLAERQSERPVPLAEMQGRLKRDGVLQADAWKSGNTARPRRGGRGCRQSPVGEPEPVPQAPASAPAALTRTWPRT